MLFTPEDRARGVHEHELQDARATAWQRTSVTTSARTAPASTAAASRAGSAPAAIGFAKIARDLTQQRDAADALHARARPSWKPVSAHAPQSSRARSTEHEAAKTAVTTLLHRLVTAQEDERARIARDLHDQMGQQLTVLRLALERAQQEPSSESAASSISQALELTSELGRDVDFLSWQLRPAVLDELGLIAALPRFVAEWASHVGIPAVFRGVGYEHGQLPREAEVAFYRIAQEALNNIAKHSHASRVDVVLGANDGRVTLVVEDDGLGFDLGEESVNAKGFGLSGMRERAALRRRQPAHRIEAGQRDVRLSHAAGGVARAVSGHGVGAFMIRVMLVEDHETVREGLQLLLNAQPDMEIVGEAGDGGTAVDRVGVVNPDVVVLDLTMPGMSGLETAKSLKTSSRARVVALTRHDDDAFVQELTAAGAVGYVLKQSPSSELLRAIRAASTGGVYLDPACSSRIIRAIRGGARTLRRRPSASWKCCA